MSRRLAIVCVSALMMLPATAAFAQRFLFGDGSGYELDVIASAVVGGASLSGGKGSALGALLGALIIKMIDNGIVILGIDQSYSRIIIGVVVILAVMLDQFNTWLAKRRLTKTV